MKPLDTFVIPFKGLKLGTHTYDLQVNDKFFDHFDVSEIQHASVSVHVEMVKMERMLDFHLSMTGEVSLPCDRCNELVALPVAGTERLIVKFGEDFHEESEEVQIIPESESQFDLAPFIYEYVHLMLPMRRLHPEDDKGQSGCNPDILTRLNDLLQKRSPDPRWDVLEKLRGKEDESPRK